MRTPPQATSALRLGGLVPNISEFLRSFEKPSLAALPFLVGRGRVNQKVYLPGRHLSCFRSFLRSRGGPLGARGMESRDDRPAFSANDVGYCGGCDDSYALPFAGLGHLLQPAELARVNQGSRRLPACETILNAIGDLLAYGCQLE